MTLIKRVIFIFLGICCIGACSSDDSSKGAAPAPDPGQKPWNGQQAYGEINGKEWLFKSGTAHIIRKHWQYYLIIRLWDEAFEDPCNERQGTSLQVRMMAPKRVDHWEISPEDPFNSTFSIFFSDRDFNPHPQDNMKADEGKITFLAIEKNKVMGYFEGSFKHVKVGRTEIQGGFSVPLCDGYSYIPDSFGDNFSL